MIFILKTTGLFLLAACAEIIGCYLSYLWLKQGKTVWLLLPAAVSLGLFVWLLTFHQGAPGQVYAAYGGVYVTTAIFWLWLVENQRPDRWDILGVTVSLIGMGIIVFAPRGQ